MTKKPMNVLIVYEDNSVVLEKLAIAAEKAVKSADRTVKLRSASKVAIPELLASDAFFFGIDTVESPSYTELRRLFKGICLAGRRGACFSSASAKAPDSLKAALAETELQDSGPVASGLKGAEFSSWVKARLA